MELGFFTALEHKNIVVRMESGNPRESPLASIMNLGNTTTSNPPFGQHTLSIVAHHKIPSSAHIVASGAAGSGTLIRPRARRQLSTVEKKKPQGNKTRFLGRNDLAIVIFTETGVAKTEYFRYRNRTRHKYVACTDRSSKNDSRHLSREILYDATHLSKLWMIDDFTVLDPKEGFKKGTKRWMDENAVDTFNKRIEEVASVWNLGETPLPQEEDLVKISCNYNGYAVGKVYLLGHETINESVEIAGWKDPSSTRWGNEHFYVAKCIGLKKTKAEKGYCMFWCPGADNPNDKNALFSKDPETLKQLNNLTPFYFFTSHHMFFAAN